MEQMRNLGSLPDAERVVTEHVQVTLDDARFQTAMAKLEADDRRELRGSVMLVNFWATWCPPCRKEMPDLEALYGQFAQKGLVILAISDEDTAKVQPFIAERQFTARVRRSER